MKCTLLVKTYYVGKDICSNFILRYKENICNYQNKWIKKKLKYDNIRYK